MNAIATSALRRFGDMVCLEWKLQWATDHVRALRALSTCVERTGRRASCFETNIGRCARDANMPVLVNVQTTSVGRSAKEDKK
jgi:hypothetical protein